MERRKPCVAGRRVYAGISEMARTTSVIAETTHSAIAVCCADDQQLQSGLSPDSNAGANLAYSKPEPSLACAYRCTRRIRKRNGWNSARLMPIVAMAYLAFSAIADAGIGWEFRNQIDPGPPLDKDIYDMSLRKLKNVSIDAGLA